MKVTDLKKTKKKHINIKICQREIDLSRILPRFGEPRNALYKKSSWCQ